MLTRRAATGLVAMLFAAPAALAQGGAKRRIAFANYSDEAVFGAAVLRGFQEAARKRPDVEVLYFDNRQDAAKAIDNARTIVAAKPDAVIWYSTLPDVNKRVAQLFGEAKLPVIAVQTPVPDAPLFAVDNPLSGYESGKAAAEAFRKRFGGEQPEVLVLGWPENGPLFIDRADAAKKAIQETFTGVAFEEFSTTGDTGRARQLTADFLTRRPGRKAIIWAHVDAMGIAALAAVRNAGREGDVVIATTGGDRSVLPEVRKASSAFVGTFSFFPEFWGEDLLDLAVRRSNGQEIPARVSPRRQLFVTAANVAEYYPQ